MRDLWVIAAVAASACGDSGTLPGDAAPGTDVACAVSITAIPGDLQFGAHLTSQPVTGAVAIANTGTCTTGALSHAVGGMHPGDFTTASSSCDGQTLGPGASCIVTVRFAPSSSGARSAVLTISGAGAPLPVPLTGNGILGSSDLIVSPPFIDFGTAAPPSTKRTITITNGGNVPTGTLTTQLVGSNPASYLLVADTCSGATLAGSTSCTLQVQTTCAAPGVAQSAAVSVVGNPGGSVSVPVTGTVDGPFASKACFAVFAPSPPVGMFGDQQVGTTSAASRFTFTNFGGQPSAALSPTLGGSDPGSFSIGASTCTGATVPGSGACTIDVAFAPPSPGTKIAVLVVGNASLALSGNGLGPAKLELAPAMKDFGSVSTGTQAPATTFTLTNTGSIASTAVTTAITGDFELVTDGCAGAPLAAQTSCTIDARFAPTSTGVKTGQLTAMASTGGTASSMLAGTGITGGGHVQMNPTNLQFPITTVGASSTAMSIDVSWTGVGTTGALTTSLTGASAGDFQIDADTCAGMPLTQGGTCRLDLSFRPSATGQRTATIVLSASPGGTVGAALLGTGQ